MGVVSLSGGDLMTHNSALERVSCCDVCFPQTYLSEVPKMYSKPSYIYIAVCRKKNNLIVNTIVYLQEVLPFELVTVLFGHLLIHLLPLMSFWKIRPTAWVRMLLPPATQGSLVAFGLERVVGISVLWCFMPRLGFNNRILERKFCDLITPDLVLLFVSLIPGI